jgi:DNA repair protein RecN (Recombination protein N)
VLQQLEFSNLATFEQARLELDSGLNILSGMSGAGKSVVLMALKLSLGGRFSQRLLRDHADEAEVRALYVLPAFLKKKYEEELPGIEDVLIRRVFRREGRTINYINDKMVSLGLLSRLGEDLAKVLSQDEAMGLKDPDEQRALLDTFAGLSLEVEIFAKTYSEFRKCEREMEALKHQSVEAAQREQFNRFQLDELESLHLEDGEFVSLENDLKVLGQSSDLMRGVESLVSGADAFLSQGEGALVQLQRAVGDVQGWKELIDEGVELKESMREWSRALGQQGDDLDSDPEKLFQVEQRLLQLRGAFKKYGMDEVSLLTHLAELKLKVDGPPVEVELERLKEASLEKQRVLKKKAKVLHVKREKASLNLSKEVNDILAKLEMGGERFSIKLSATSELQKTGGTDVVFMLRPTEEAPANPLHESASGGERSRALLGICSALRGAMGSPLLVFDEVDTNIGSRLGKPISEAFHRLSSEAQVICVTHLAPVAASGVSHFVVEKGAQVSVVKKLSKKERVSELAHMLAGERDSKEALQQAKGMLKQYQV